MSMNSALSLSFQNIILIEQEDQALLPGFIYIYIIIYLQYVQYVGQKFHGRSISHQFDFHHKIKFYIYLLFQREINAIGEPTSQVITNWDATRGTPLGQRGATRDKSPRTEV